MISLPPGSIPGTTTVIHNQDNTEIFGVELETNWLITENWSVGLNLGTLDYETAPYTQPCLIIDTCDGVPTDTLRNLGDNDLGRAPEWTAAVNVLYSRELAGGGHIGFNVSGRRVGDHILTETGGVGRIVEGGYSIVDARFQYDFPISEEGMASIAIFGKNLTDAEYLEQALFLGNGPLLPDGGPATGFQGWGAPETWGIEFSVDL